MNQTDKVFGKLAAMHTFIEKFPMSILDMMQTKHYTSTIDFMVDVLIACGVDTNELIGGLLNTLYGIDGKIGDAFGFYEKVKYGEIELESHNKFIDEVETVIKTTFAGILSSLFTCSALPILPNYIFDGANYNNFRYLKNQNVLGFLSNNIYPSFLIHKSSIDPMGLLDINPTSDEGRLYYAIEGKNVFYKKQYIPVIKEYVEKKIASETGEKQVIKYEKIPLYNKQIKLKIVGETPNNSGDIKFIEDINKICIIGGEVAPKDIKITIGYVPYGERTVQTWETMITSGSTETKDVLNCSPINEKGKHTIINYISINDNGPEVNIGNKTWVYISKEESSDFLKKWQDNGLNSIEWGHENNETTSSPIIVNLQLNKGEEYEETVLKSIYDYSYVEIDNNEAFSVGVKNFKRVNYVPTENITSNSPEYIVHYDGLNPNFLYKTNDMNAFLWYVLNKGANSPQIEYNHMMWDSRISAFKNGVARKSPEEWNQWYNSKVSYTDEFKYFGENIVNETPLYPIIQLAPQYLQNNTFVIKLPSQKYFNPKIRNYAINGGGEEGAPKNGTNTSIFKYNWDYLNNIQILNTKLMVVKMVEYLINGGIVSTFKNINFNISKSIIEAKLSSAIKSIIESDDMQVEDCYTTFSNDEINAMLEEMLLSRYKGGSGTATIRTHNTKNYLALIDSINPTATQEGNVNTIKKLITEVTTTPGEEGSIDYKIGIDGNNILKKLLWAIIMPILLSLFTPQLMLLLQINFSIVGLTKYEDFLNQDFTKIFNLIMNKIFGLIKSIILYVKDIIVDYLLKIFVEKVLPLLLNYQTLILLEKITYWLNILRAAFSCLLSLKFKSNKIIGAIDNVNYADIESTQTTPESTASC